MRVLIIGGSGIISTGITRLLVERSDEVVLYNRGQRASQVESGYEAITGDRIIEAWRAIGDRLAKKFAQ